MVGNLKPHFCTTEQSLHNEFMLYYCSLCSSIRNKYGITSSFTLNYDVTLILLSLANYLDNSESSNTRCPAKQFLSKNNTLKHPAFTKAADIANLLVALKLIDNQTDEDSVIKTNPLINVINYSFQKRLDRIMISLSEKTRVIVSEYISTIDSPLSDFEKTKHLSGLLAQHLFYEISSLTSISSTIEENCLGNFFYILGKALCCLDPLVDLSDDIQKYKSNIIEYRSVVNNTSLEVEFETIANQYLELSILLDENINNYIIHENKTFALIFGKILESNFIKINNISESLFNRTICNPGKYLQTDKSQCNRSKIAAIGIFSMIPLLSCDGGCGSCFSFTGFLSSGC